MALPFLDRMWFFMSPLLYPVQLVPEQWWPLYYLNPMALVLSGFRWALAGAPPVPWWAWLEGSLVAVLCWSVGSSTSACAKRRSRTCCERALDGLAIQVRGIGKRYRVGRGRQASSVVDRVGRMAASKDRNPFADSTHLGAARHLVRRSPRPGAGHPRP